MASSWKKNTSCILPWASMLHRRTAKLTPSVGVVLYWDQDDLITRGPYVQLKVLMYMAHFLSCFTYIHLTQCLWRFAVEDTFVRQNLGCDSSNVGEYENSSRYLKLPKILYDIKYLISYSCTKHSKDYTAVFFVHVFWNAITAHT